MYQNYHQIPCPPRRIFRPTVAFNPCAIKEVLTLFERSWRFLLVTTFAGGAYPGGNFSFSARPTSANDHHHRGPRQLPAWLASGRCLPKKNSTAALGATPVSASPNTMRGAADSPTRKAHASAESLNSGFVAMELRIWTARPLAEALMSRVSSPAHVALVLAKTAGSKALGSPKKASLRLLSGQRISLSLLHHVAPGGGGGEVMAYPYLRLASCSKMLWRPRSVREKDALSPDGFVRTACPKSPTEILSSWFTP